MRVKTVNILETDAMRKRLSTVIGQDRSPSMRRTPAAKR